MAPPDLPPRRVAPAKPALGAERLGQVAAAGPALRPNWIHARGQEMGRRPRLFRGRVPGYTVRRTPFRDSKAMTTTQRATLVNAHASEALTGDAHGVKKAWNSTACRDRVRPSVPAIWTEQLGEKAREEEHGQRVDPEHDEGLRPRPPSPPLDQPVARGQREQGDAAGEHCVRAGPERLVDRKPVAPEEPGSHRRDPGQQKAPRRDRWRPARSSPPAGEHSEQRGADGGHGAEDTLRVMGAAGLPDMRPKHRSIDPGGQVTCLAEIARPEAWHRNEGERRPVAGRGDRRDEGLGSPAGE
jgi:hypothetical protein